MFGFARLVVGAPAQILILKILLGIDLVSVVSSGLTLMAHNICLCQIY